VEPQSLLGPVIHDRQAVDGDSADGRPVACPGDEIAQAVRRKLVLEIAARRTWPRPRLIRVALRKPPPCDIGEWLRRQRIREWEDDTY